MTAQDPRRGEVRPISDLPDLPGTIAYVEVEGEDGRAYRAPGSSVGGAIFPDTPSTYGTATADDEEWDGAETLAERGWTSETTPTAPNVTRLNTTFNPSRLAIYAANPLGGDVISIYRPLTVSAAGSLSVTFDAAGVFDANFKSLEVGFRTSALAASAAETVVLGHSTNTALIRRKYSNLGTSTFVDQGTTTIGTVAETFNLAHRYYFHLQRVAGSWEAFYSIDGATWTRIGAGTADAFTTAYLMLRMGGFSQNVPRYVLANDWIRLNRFFL